MNKNQIEERMKGILERETTHAKAYQSAIDITFLLLILSANKRQKTK